MLRFKPSKACVVNVFLSVHRTLRHCNVVYSGGLALGRGGQIPYGQWRWGLCPLSFNREKSVRRRRSDSGHVFHDDVELWPSVSFACCGQCCVQTQVWAAQTVPISGNVYCVRHGDWLQVCLALGDLLTQPMPCGHRNTGKEAHQIALSVVSPLSFYPGSGMWNCAQALCFLCTTVLLTHYKDVFENRYLISKSFKLRLK